MPDEENDLTVYDLAEQIAGGMPRSVAAYREVARELLKVREEVRLVRLALHSDDPERATIAIDEAVARMGLL